LSWPWKAWAGEVHYPSRQLVFANKPSAGEASAHPPWHLLGIHEDRGIVQLSGVIELDAVIQAGSTWTPLHVQDRVYTRGMKNSASKQESVGAFGRLSGGRGHRKTLASMMSGREYLAPMRKTRIAPSKGNEHGEQCPAVPIRFDRALLCYPLLADRKVPSLAGYRDGDFIKSCGRWNREHPRSAGRTPFQHLIN